jgi:hypothetical protein
VPVPVAPIIQLPLPPPLPAFGGVVLLGLAADNTFEAAVIVGVELLDHLVLGATGRWTSLRERGAW